MAKVIYCWHEPEHDAIKVGVGDNAHGRGQDYARERGLSYDSNSLRTFKVPFGFDAMEIERHCHIMVMRNGMRRFPGNCTELFKLNGRAYAEVALMVGRMVERCIDCIRTDTEINYDLKYYVPNSEERMTSFHNPHLMPLGSSVQCKHGLGEYKCHVCWDTGETWPVFEPGNRCKHGFALSRCDTCRTQNTEAWKALPVDNSTCRHGYALGRCQTCGEVRPLWAANRPLPK